MNCWNAFNIGFDPSCLLSQKEAIFPTPTCPIEQPELRETTFHAKKIVQLKKKKNTMGIKRN